MLRLLVLLASISLSGGALAQWTPLAESDLGTLYTDLSTLEKREGSVHVWELFDYALPQRTESGRRFLSVKTLREYNCKVLAYRDRSATWHADRMGGGEVVARQDARGKSRPVPPRGFVERGARAACRD